MRTKNKAKSGTTGNGSIGAGNGGPFREYNGSLQSDKSRVLVSVDTRVDTPRPALFSNQELIDLNKKTQQAVLDPTKVTAMVVNARLGQVAAQLATMAPSSSVAVLTEDQLLDDTPSPSPPPGLAECGGPGKDAIAMVPGSPDLIGERVQSIFGKRRASDHSDQDMSSPKVAVTGLFSLKKDDATVKSGETSLKVPDPLKKDDATVKFDEVSNKTSELPKIDATVKLPITIAPPDDDQGSNALLPELEPLGPLVIALPPAPVVPPVVELVVPVVPEIQPAPVQEVPMDVEHNAENNAPVVNWGDAIEVDQPVLYPVANFPNDLPEYPSQPEFEYRYRVLNSTPRSRRVDFERAIVLPTCRRDQYTGLISQDDYDHREDSEMKLALGPIGYSFWLDERQRRLRQGLPVKRNRRNNNKVPSYFYTTRVRNPVDVRANESPNFRDDQAEWRGIKVIREHVTSDAHENSELRHDGPTESLLRLRAQNWLDPMDGNPVSGHLVTIVMRCGNTQLVEKAPINPVVYLSPPTLWLSGTLDNGNIYGEVNTNAKLFSAEIIAEPLAVLLGIVRGLDSSTFCPQRGDFQISCADADCPRCNSKHMSVSTLKPLTIVALLAKDLVARLPHATLDDGVTPHSYRTQFHGNFPTTTLNSRDFRDRRAYDRHGNRLVTRLYLGDNYGRDDATGDILKSRKFIEDAVWAVISRVPGNTHLRLDALFEETDAFYSLTQPSVYGNYRAFYLVNLPGRPLTCPVAKFRLDKRSELTIKWHLLSCDTIVILIGAFFQLWQNDRQRQMEEFLNVTIDSEEGHLRHSVTPTQLYAFRETRRVIDPDLANEDYMHGWVNTAFSRGLTPTITARLQQTADALDRIL